MIAKVILFSHKHGEISNFLNKFYTSDISQSSNFLQNTTIANDFSYTTSEHETKNSKSFSWEKEFPNPVEISEIIAAFADNHDSFEIDMWISLDEDVFIKISHINVDEIIKYLFERFPY